MSTFGELSKSIQKLCVLFLLLLCKYECLSCFYFNEKQFVISSNTLTFLKIDSHSGLFCNTSVATHKVVICTNYLIQLNILNSLKIENTNTEGVTNRIKLSQLFRQIHRCTCMPQQIPRTGLPIVNIAGSNQGASSAYTELGPPEMIIALWI